MVDRRINKIYTLMDTGKFNLLSLDIFDTAVYRCVPRPTDVFFLLGKKLKESSYIQKSSSIGSFVAERINSENRARRKKYYCTEVTLKEIYDEFPGGYFSNFSTLEVADAEFQLEQELIFPHPEMRDLIIYAKDKGLKTAFVSDTYFKTNQIKRLVGIDVDHIILSCENNVSKYHGLHLALLKESGVPPERILHVGDNETADIKGPEIFNIERYWFRNLPEKFDELFEIELPQVFSDRASYVSTDDQGLTFMRCRAANACRTDYEIWGAAVLGPIIGGFSDWIIQKSAQMRLQHVFCLMREGDILKRVLDLYPNMNIAFHKLYISRFAALKAAIFEANEAELRSFVFRPSKQKMSRILRQLGLTLEDLNRTDDKILEPEATSELIRLISGTPRLRHKVVGSSKVARKNLLSHLKSMVDLSTLKEVGIVDLGYKGTIQACLQTILKKENIPVITKGLYLVTGGDVYQTQATGATAEGWLAENGQPISMAHTFMRSPEIIEQSLMAECGTTLGHDETGEPILDNIYIPETQNMQIREIQNGMLTFCQMWANRKKSNHPDALNTLKNVCRQICIRSVAEPLENELVLFGQWEHDENFGSSSSRPLLGCKLDPWELNHASVHQLASLSSTDVYWPCGLSKNIGNTIGTAVAHVFMRTNKPEAFDSGLPEQKIIFYWDSGNGFNKKNARIDTYRINNRNRVWKRFTLKMEKSTNTMFGFSLGLIGEVIQLSGVILHFLPTDGEERKIRFEQGKINKFGYRNLYGNLYLVEEDPALLMVPTPDLVRFEGQVYVDIFFALINGVQ
jgi:predicted HAD superfamily hydrolase